jgi:hypothetical protein
MCVEGVPAGEIISDDFLLVAVCHVSRYLQLIAVPKARTRFGQILSPATDLLISRRVPDRLR